MKQPSRQPFRNAILNPGNQKLWKLEEQVGQRLAQEAGEEGLSRPGGAWDWLDTGETHEGVLGKTENTLIW